MTDTQNEASDHARALVARRWGDAKIWRAIADLAERADRLDSEHKAALRFLGRDPKGQDDE